MRGGRAGPPVALSPPSLPPSASLSLPPPSLLHLSSALSLSLASIQKQNVRHLRRLRPRGCAWPGQSLAGVEGKKEGKREGGTNGRREGKRAKRNGGERGKGTRKWSAGGRRSPPYLNAIRCLVEGDQHVPVSAAGRIPGPQLQSLK